MDASVPSNSSSLLDTSLLGFESTAEDDWRAFCACVDEHATFSSVPRGMAFSPGSRLLEARHVPISCNQDLIKVPVTSKRIWVRIADPSTSRRKLSKASLLFLQFWKQLSTRPSRLRALRHPPAWDVEAAADAHGSGPHLGIGGYFRVGTGPCFWFSEQWTVDDFAFTLLELQSDAQRNICCYEALGQIALVHCLSAVTPGGRLFVRVPSWCDNTGAESVNDKLFASDWPLAAFVQRLAVYSVETGVELDVSHISGEKNTLAVPADGVSSGGSHGADPHSGRRGVASQKAGQSSIHQFFSTHSAAGVHDPGSREPRHAHTAVSGSQADGCASGSTDGGWSLAVSGLGDRQASPVFQAPDATRGDDGPDSHHQGRHQGGECSAFSIHQAADDQLPGRPAIIADGHLGSSAGSGNVLQDLVDNTVLDLIATRVRPARSRRSPQMDKLQAWLSQRH